MLKYYQLKGLLQLQHWMVPAYVGVDQIGNIQYLSSNPPQEAVAIEYVNGMALPGFQNAHSHAFQYAMAGKAEIHPAGTTDDFWSWREAMYNCALAMEPQTMQAVAAMAYVEMVKKGYTHVAEFHYLHHDKNGKPYHNLAEMGEQLIHAASIAGIQITLLPVFYKQGGFGKAAQPQQRRFISNNVDDYFHLLDESARIVKNYANAQLGFGVHSLRAVDANDMIKIFNDGPKDIPFHLHAAEQLKEVEDCIQHLGQRPVEWLLNHLPMSDRFHVVHCTHMVEQEIEGLAKSGASVVLCPGTEGNLGDGIFPLVRYARCGGSWSIGTDSHISLNPLEDLRWLDYAQRFTSHKRNTFNDGATVLIQKTTQAGRSAMGNQHNDYFSIGKPFDAVIYSAETPLLSGRSINHILSSLVYSADSSNVLGTIIRGKWIVKNQHHIHDEAVRSRFIQAMKSLNS
jgi:formimidoylglutamate deiminase